MFGCLWFELLVVVVIVVVPIEASHRGYILYLNSTQHADLFLKLDGRALEKIQEWLILLQSSKILVWWLVVACCKVQGYWSGGLLLLQTYRLQTLTAMPI